MLYNLFENRDFVSVFAVALLAEGVDRNNGKWHFTRGMAPRPFLRPAVEDHIKELQDIAVEEGNKDA